jgi:hypothetical protein
LLYLKNKSLRTKTQKVQRNNFWLAFGFAGNVRHFRCKVQLVELKACSSELAFFISKVKDRNEKLRNPPLADGFSMFFTSSTLDFRFSRLCCGRFFYFPLLLAMYFRQCNFSLPSLGETAIMSLFEGKEVIVVIS